MARFSSKHRKLQDFYGIPRSLEYDYYRNSCPQAEQIIRVMVFELNQTRPDSVPALLRLVFHDCFIEGCDASLLLDSTDGVAGEKETSPNQSLKGFEIIDLIKSKLEQVCPRVVSCADLLVLAAREAVILGGGPFYPLLTGRRDSTISFPEVAEYELPSPQDDLAATMARFSSRGFDKRETVALLGAHSVGVIHCTFFFNRLYNFNGGNNPDPSVNPQFLNIMRAACDPSNTTSSSSSSSSSSTSTSTSSSSSSTTPTSSTINIITPPFSSAEESESEMKKMDYKGASSGFGTLYYQSLLENKGILFADQQLTSEEEASHWVRVYASDSQLFQQDFALVMMKLSNLSVLTFPLGQVRSDCRRVAAY